jgi:hypothetical protein
VSRRPRLPLAIVGAGLALAGLATVLAPALGPDLPETYLTVLLVGGLALLAGLGASATLPVGRTAADLPAVERRLTVPAPGDEFDQDVAGLPARRTRGSEPTRRLLRDRLEAAATAALVREGLDRETARSRLVDGSWTDDPRAAAFFRGDSPSTRERVGRFAGGASPFARRARATARVVARRLDAGGSTPGSAGSAGSVLTAPGGRLGPARSARGANSGTSASDRSPASGDGDGDGDGDGNGDGTTEEDRP